MKQTNKPKAGILSIESSGAACSVALSAANRILAEYRIDLANCHDRFLAELCKRLLTDMNLAVSDLAAVAVSAGPGSFTGLRIGAALAKALCFEQAPALVAVPTLLALAQAAIPAARAVSAGSICAVIPSHQQLLYTQHFTLEAEASGAISVVQHAAFRTTLRDDILYCGPGMDSLGLPIPPDLARCSARKVAAVAARKLEQGDTTDPLSFTPLYGQEFIPKVRRQQSEKSKQHKVEPT